VYTKPKWEKKVAEQLKDWNRMLLSSGSSGQTMVRQKKKGRSTTFNSYVFVQLSEADRNVVFNSLVLRYLFC
jgi:hypothetical protein